MSESELRNYVRFLYEQIQQKDARHKELLAQISDIKDELKTANSELKTANSEQRRLNALVLSLTEQLHDAQQRIIELSRKNSDLESSARVSKKHRFGNSD